MGASLQHTLRARDYDRYILSLFFPASHRLAAWAILSLYAEVMEVVDKVHEPLAGALRLAWWRERLGDMYAGKPAANHPVLQVLSEVIPRYDLPLALWEQMLEAAGTCVEAVPCATQAAFEQRAQQWVMPLYEALARLEGELPEQSAELELWATLEGMRSLLQRAAKDARCGRVVLPQYLLGEYGVTEAMLAQAEAAAAVQKMYIKLVERMDELLQKSHKEKSEKRIINAIIVYNKLQHHDIAAQIKSKDFRGFRGENRGSKGLLALRIAVRLLLTK